MLLTDDDDMLIDTPWGKKRWGMLREAMELYNKQQNEKENDMDSDLLDEYCDNKFGHTDWEMSWDKDGNLNVTFHKEARQEYLDEQDDDEGEEE